MSEQPHDLRLTGLDAQDPLAYLAALGCLLGATNQCQRAGLPTPKLSFDVAGVPIPTLHGPWSSLGGLAEALMVDLDEIAGRGPTEAPRDAFLAFSYPDDKDEPVRDLKPPPDRLRAFAQGLVDHVSPHDRRTLDWVSAMLTDVAVDNNGGAKPFALHFTAGQQRFLVVALELLDGAENEPRPDSPSRPVDIEDLRIALAGPWPNDRALKVFSWSPTQDRAYALRASNPSTDQKLGTPGADWLALRGIGLLSSAPVGDEIHTSGVHGRWKTGSFSYPIWPLPIDADAARSLLRHPAIGPAGGGRERARARRTLPRGVEVLTCRISRSDQGGYGAFSRPSRA